MKKSFKTPIKVLALTCLVAIIITAMGFGCGVSWQPVGLSSLENSLGVALDAGDNGDLVVVSGQRTTSVAYYDQVLANLLSISGIETPRSSVTNMYNARVGSLSENGSVLTINAPMLLGFAAVGAEVCDQVIDTERASTADNRVLFGPFFARSNIDDISENDVRAVTRRLARTFWQRNETHLEMEMILSGMDEMLTLNDAGSNAAQEISKAALYLCTSMIASTSTYEM